LTRDARSEVSQLPAALDDRRVSGDEKGTKLGSCDQVALELEHEPTAHGAIRHSPLTLAAKRRGALSPIAHMARGVTSVDSG
jgi:hypothetical protein